MLIVVINTLPSTKMEPEVAPNVSSLNPGHGTHTEIKPPANGLKLPRSDSRGERGPGKALGRLV